MVADAPWAGAASSPTRGRIVDLVPLGLARLEPLYEMALVGGAGATWRTRGRTVSIEQFAAYLWEGGDCAFAAAERTSAELVGFVGLYGLDPHSGVASLSAFFDPRQPRATLLAGDALEVFCRYAFGVLGLRKLTIEIPARGGAGLVAAATRLPFLVSEGTLREHARIGPALHDVEIYAVWGDAYLAWAQALVAPPDDVGSGAVPGRLGDDLVGRIRALVAELTDLEVPDELAGGFRLVDDLGLDSLALIELLVVLEAELGQPLPLEALGGQPTVQDLVTLIEHVRLRAGGSSMTRLGGTGR